MNEADFLAMVAPFTTKTVAELSLTDDLGDLGMDSISVFEILMKVEDDAGISGVTVTEAATTVQDIYDAVTAAAEDGGH
ncbi:MAG: acyl carrier protein [Actinomycetales bacterium]